MANKSKAILIRITEEDRKLLKILCAEKSTSAQQLIYSMIQKILKR